MLGSHSADTMGAGEGVGIGSIDALGHASDDSNTRV
jgi:hypothetical protein